MMTELIRRVKFRCIPMDTANVRVVRTAVGEKATLPPNRGSLDRQTSGAEELGNELPQGAER